MALFAHKCPRCGALFAAELGKLQQGQITIRNLCPECQWIKTYVHTKDNVPTFVPLSEKDQLLKRS